MTQRITPEQRRLRAKLQKVRAADAEHDARMRALLEGSGITLKQCRTHGKTARSKDAFMLAAFAKARRAKEREE